MGISGAATCIARFRQIVGRDCSTISGSTRLPMERVFRTTTHERLTLIPCGTRLKHGPELLGTARMAELINLLRSRFEAIVVDSPPLGAGIDPFVLGTHTGNILIVLRTGETDRTMAEVKLRVLERLPLRILGAVLNHIQGGVGPYKYYTYSYGYAPEDELAEKREPLAPQQDGVTGESKRCQLGPWREASARSMRSPGSA